MLPFLCVGPSVDASPGAREAEEYIEVYSGSRQEFAVDERQLPWGVERCCVRWGILAHNVGRSVCCVAQIPHN